MLKFEQLKQENINIARDIGNAESVQDHDEIIRLKRVLYENKLKMLDLLTQKDMKLTISAEDLKTKIANMKPVVRYETGLSYLDDELKSFDGNNVGFEVGSLILLGGQSGAGKSHIMLEMLSNISTYSKVAFFNFEMGDRRLNYRLSKLLRTETQYKNFLVNSESRDLDDLIMEIKLLAEDGVVFFAIDSKMKLSVKGNEQEYQKISSITKKLSEVAIKLDIIIFLINQISEENLKSGWKSFKGSGDQIYDADMALFLTIIEDGFRLLECSKNRQDEKVFSIKLPKPVQYTNMEVTEYKE